MSIVAALDKVLFFNASSKYSVLRMKTEDSSVPTEARSPYRYHDHLIRFTAVGIELPQTDTVKIEMDGEWKDGKYGLQLQVDHWQEIVPPTLEGVRNYLASGLLKGIGEKTADVIIEKFGVNALEILEHQPDRLLEIRGITKERLAEIKDAYAETSRMRVLMTLLAPFKVTPTTAQKIYQHFGPACADIVRQSPFNLCQVPGFGFKRIDAIVQKSGGDLRDPKRVHGALFYALEDARTKDGHLYLEAESLLKAAMQLLNERIPLPQMRVPMSQVEQELSAMIRQDEVVSNHGNVYLPKQFLQESETAQKAVELFLAKPTVVDITQPLERVKHSLGLNLSKRQSEGVEMVFRHTNAGFTTDDPFRNGRAEDKAAESHAGNLSRTWGGDTVSSGTPLFHSYGLDWMGYSLWNGRGPCCPTENSKNSRSVPGRRVLLLRPVQHTGLSAGEHLWKNAFQHCPTSCKNRIEGVCKTLPGLCKPQLVPVCVGVVSTR